MRRALLLLPLVLHAAQARAVDGPSPEMMQAVHALATCMARGLPDDCAVPFAARGTVIAENFAPYFFTGPTALDRWRTEFRRHLATGGVEHLQYQFGEVRDFSRDGQRVYFSLPTTWSGTSGPRRFEEPGAWSFVLMESAGGVRILGYAWAITDLRVVQ